MEGDHSIQQVINFVEEATRSLQEVAYAVNTGSMSPSLPCKPECVYFNLTTRENQRFCVRLTMRGFEVVGRDHDSLELEDEPDSGEAFETVYSLLDHLSPSYRASFHHALSDRLVQLESEDPQQPAAPVSGQH